MDISQLKLPSNRKFGFFFTVIFLFFSWYFSGGKNLYVTYLFIILSIIIFIITILKSDLLLPLNKLWMKFGLLLSIIVSPLVMGIIFFGLFTPISILMKIFGRDELQLKLKTKQTFWKTRKDNSLDKESLKRQY